jgi:hypothetical protein
MQQAEQERRWAESGLARTKALFFLPGLCSTLKFFFLFCPPCLAQVLSLAAQSALILAWNDPICRQMLRFSVRSNGPFSSQDRSPLPHVIKSTQNIPLLQT